MHKLLYFILFHVSFKVLRIHLIYVKQQQCERHNKAFFRNFFLLNHTLKMFPFLLIIKLVIFLSNSLLILHFYHQIILFIFLMCYKMNHMIYVLLYEQYRIFIRLILRVNLLIFYQFRMLLKYNKYLLIQFYLF